ECLANILVVSVQVGQIGTDVLKQSERLASAVEGACSVVGGAHVAAEERLTRAGTNTGVGVNLLWVVNESWTRNRIVLQARDMPQLERQVHRGLPIRRIEGAVLRGVLVDTHGDVEGSLDACYCSCNLHVHAIAGSAGDLEAVRFRETNHSVIILLAGTKPRGEFFHGE